MRVRAFGYAIPERRPSNDLVGAQVLIEGAERVVDRLSADGGGQVADEWRHELAKRFNGAARCRRRRVGGRHERSHRIVRS
jgi:hypothetical protein